MISLKDQKPKHFQLVLTCRWYKVGNEKMKPFKWQVLRYIIKDDSEGKERLCMD